MSAAEAEEGRKTAHTVVGIQVGIGSWAAAEQRRTGCIVAGTVAGKMPLAGLQFRQRCQVELHFHWAGNLLGTRTGRKTGIAGVPSAESIAGCKSAGRQACTGRVAAVDIHSLLVPGRRWVRLQLLVRPVGKNIAFVPVERGQIGMNIGAEVVEHIHMPVASLVLRLPEIKSVFFNFKCANVI